MMNANQKAAHRDRQKVRSERFRQAGLCINCGRSRDTAAVHCGQCRDSNARSQHQQFERQQIAPVSPRLPFYPVAQKHVRYWPPPVLGSLAVIMARIPLGQG